MFPSDVTNVCPTRTNKQVPKEGVPSVYDGYKLDHSGEHKGRLLTPEWLVYGPPFARLHSVGRAQEGSDRRARVFGPANEPSPRAEWP